MSCGKGECTLEEASKIVEKLPCVERSALPLRDHQVRVVHHMLNFDSLIVIHQIGCGKTLTAVTALQCILEKFPDMHAFVVTPVSLEGNFRKEFKKYLKPGSGLKASDVRIHYYSFDGMSKALQEKPRLLRGHFLIVDEAHNLRTQIADTHVKAAGIRTLTIVKGAQQAAKVLLMTGTPIVNRPTDLNNLLSMVRKLPIIKEPDMIWDKNAYKCWFSYMKCSSMQGYPRVKEYNEEFIMDEDMLNRYHVVEFGISGVTDIEAKLNSDSDSWKTFSSGTRRVVNLWHSPKISWTIQKIIRNVEKGKKTIYFSDFLECGSNLVAERLDDLSIPYATINGKVSAKRRTEVVQSYNDKTILVLLLSKAGGEGLDLKETTTVILDTLWNEASEDQVIGRAARYKSHSTLDPEDRLVEVHRLIMKKPDPEEGLTTDELMFKARLVKQFKISLFMRDFEKLSIEHRTCTTNSKAVAIKFVEVATPSQSVLDHWINKTKRLFQRNVHQPDEDFTQEEQKLLAQRGKPWKHGKVILKLTKDQKDEIEWAISERESKQEPEDLLDELIEWSTEEEHEDNAPAEPAPDKRSSSVSPIPPTRPSIKRPPVALSDVLAQYRPPAPTTISQPRMAQKNVTLEEVLRGYVPAPMTVSSYSSSHTSFPQRKTSYEQMYPGNTIRQ